MMSTFVNNPLAPSIFVNAAAGFFKASDNVHITFATVAADHSGNQQPDNVVNLRLVIPLGSAFELASELFAFCTENGCAVAKDAVQ